MTPRAPRSLLLLVLLPLACSVPVPAEAQTRSGRTAASKKTEASSSPKPGDKDGDAEREVGGADEQAAGDQADEVPVKAVEVKQGEEGVKTYKFGTIEVEGRLKAPQILYFLRRVRAEFEAGLLGHRSFLRELSDTRRHPALNQ